MEKADQPTPPAAPPEDLSSPLEGELVVTLDLSNGEFLFEWLRTGRPDSVARGRLTPQLYEDGIFQTAFAFQFEPRGIEPADFCDIEPNSVHALFRRVRVFTPPQSNIRYGLLSDVALGIVQAGKWHPIQTLPCDTGWKWLGRLVSGYGRMLDRPPPSLSAKSADQTPAHVREVARLIAAAQLGIAPDGGVPKNPAHQLLELRIIFDRTEGRTEFAWADPATRESVAAAAVRGAGVGRLRWELRFLDNPETSESSPANRDAVRRRLSQWLERFRTDRMKLTILWKEPPSGAGEPTWRQEPSFRTDESPFPFIEESILNVAAEFAYRQSPMGRVMERTERETGFDQESYARRLERKAQKQAEEEAKRAAKIAQLAEERERREKKLAAQRLAAAEAAKKAEPKITALRAASQPRPPLPPVPVTVRMPALEFQDTAFPLADLGTFALRERAALWWVSNQSDDLLCLPHCRIERLEYQIRAALRVLGPLRGRALLSDEVGLGKTIEAGLVAKELFTRGMVKRFLVLTLPSLVDQWADELEDKFGLATVTTNQAIARGDPAHFWRNHPGIVASLHTLKQPGQLEIARQVHWDLLIVDEAHYLRNRTSQAWQAVNALPRQFLLLLTATPVQNSLEELYNLVTLLQPGQLPSPREFRARFIDPKRPRQPREPEELRRLLGQVMIRSTRANAGLVLPPRRAETVIFAPDPSEAEFWREWDIGLRAKLATFTAAQASLWGRLLLQAAGSSPAAWRAALEKFPDHDAARDWREHAPLAGSWQRKCELLVPLTREENGAVVFTQFLATQAAIADFLRTAGVPVFVINGSTPAAARQPITEEFRQRGGALLLTHSGTEGRNLQFCRTLANFDLPWNPMEIEQRIGRLHRLGQRHPVSIYNFVQAGTLQEHLLQVLQEKLNLFELVVGETGLVLGERFSGDEFEEEIYRRWQESEGGVGAAIAGLGEELAAARDRYQEVKQLDETLFAHDFESL